MPIDLREYFEPISHSLGRGETEPERARKQAIKLDEHDGLAVALGFENNSISKADYLYRDGPEFVVIEASDLRNQLDECHVQIRQLEEQELAKIRKPKLPIKIRKDIENKCYYPIKAELMQKWCGSIAVSERMCKENGITIRPNYKYTIVCKNETDIQVLDRLKIKMSGAISNIEILKTEDLG
ncbi:hypothetical protein [Vibrio sp. 99-8-1]|uniref:hypothetical protein n=1 Tax=Vibrio sp. 99-8-1 TaxID=2607602 RepID=UPI00149387A2|nr:hypothetical protein [Vibrio sp. 99-8-1]NOI65992.1 hypothetical protein [Vibrio sp. 99-8-1]